MALALVHYFPTEIPFVDRLPGIMPVLILLALAAGMRHPVEQSKVTWYAAYVTTCTLILSCGYNVGVYPILPANSFSLIVAGAVALIALSAAGLTYFKIGQLLGSRLSASPSKQFLRALSIGSICGIVLFLFFTSTALGPVILILTLLFFPAKPRLPILVAALAIACFCHSMTAKFIFSPYKKFESRTVGEGTVMLSADGLPFNFCVKIPDSQTFQHFAQMAHLQSEIDTFRYYLGRLAMPLGLSRRCLDDVLILGSSTGNDVSFALKNGAKNIDAVELDGRLVSITSFRHPDKPYQNPNVKVRVQDPRIFLSNTTKKYDLIEFCYFNPGRSDSTPYAIRPDSFIYTTECFNLALKRLKPEGVIFIGFSAPGNSLAPARLHASVLATGERAQVAYSQHDADTDPLATKYFFFGLGPGIKSLSKSDLDPFVTQFIHITAYENLPTDEKEATDNWPFVRADHREGHAIWLFTFAVIALALTIPFFGKPQRIQFYLPPLFLGISLALANYLSFTSFSLIAGFHWAAPTLILAFDMFCLYLSSHIASALKTRLSWLFYVVGGSACGALVGLGTQPIIVFLSANLLILISAISLENAFERYDSPSMVVYFSLAGLAVGCVCPLVVWYFGLNSLGIVGLISLVFSYAFEKKLLKRSKTE